MKHLYIDNISNNLYHLSSSNLNGKILKPRVPINSLTKYNLEDNTTLRVSFTPDIDSCLMALSQNIEGKEFYVHIPDHSVIYYDVNPISVPDSKLTNEKWVKNNVKLKCIGKIRVLDAIDKPYKFNYPNRPDINPSYLYKWDWKWIERYDESYLTESLSFKDLYKALEAKDDGVDLLGDNSSKPFDDAHEEAEQQRASAAPNEADPPDNTGDDDTGGSGDSGGITNTPTNQDDSDDTLDATDDSADDAGGDDADTDLDEGTGDDTDEDPTGDESDSNLENPDPPEDDTDLEKKNLLKQKFLKLYETVDANLDTLETNKSNNNSFDSHKYSILIQKFTMLKSKIFSLITNKKFFNQDYSTCVKFYIICDELYSTSIKMTESYFEEAEKALNNKNKNKRVKK